MSTADRGLNMRRFYLVAAIVVVLIAAASAMRMPREFVLGVIAGGALSIANVRQMHKGLRVLLSMDRPSALRLWFSGILRLLILASVIIIIAVMRTVDLLGLLIGFGIVPLVLVAEGLRYARSLNDSEPSAPSCKPRAGS